jgi:hypothetical protein
MKLSRYGLLAALMVSGVFGAIAHSSDDSPRRKSISVDETSNRSTIQVSSEQVIELTLHSTYWNVDGSSSDSIVTQNGTTSVVPDPPGTCAPGIGCGVVRASFTARQPGTARISASRTLCGEDLPCKPDQRSFLLTVVVVN